MTGRNLHRALRDFRQANGLRPDESGRASWTCRVGPLRLVFPNFQWRRRALDAHDLHHAMTGYPCTMRGEFQMAAWEFASGGMPHWGATLFCLPLIVAGLVCMPHRVYAAFEAGSRVRNLHGINLPEDDPVELDDRRATDNPSRLLIAVRFAIVLGQATAVVLVPVGVVLALWLVLGR